MSLAFNVLVIAPLGALAMVRAIRWARQSVRDPEDRRRLGRALLFGSSSALLGLFLWAPGHGASPWMQHVVFVAVTAIFGVFFTGCALLEKRGE